MRRLGGARLLWIAATAAQPVPSNIYELHNVCLQNVGGAATATIHRARDEAQPQPHCATTRCHTPQAAQRCATATDGDAHREARAPRGS